MKNVLKIMKFGFLCAMSVCMVTSANLVAMEGAGVQQIEQFFGVDDHDPVILTGVGFDEACGCHVDPYIAAIDTADQLRKKTAEKLNQLDVETKNLTFGQAILNPTISRFIEQSVDVVCRYIHPKQPESMKEYVLKMRIEDGLARLQR